MTPARFVMGRPCLDEVEGYKQGLKWQGISYPAEEMEHLLRWERRLREGKDLPTRRNDPEQTWAYQTKRKPVRRKTSAIR